MKKIILTCFVLLYILDLFCQQIPNSSFSESEWITCPFDSTQTILTPKHWFAYQTQNDKWDGPMDSTCITFKDTLFDFIIELEQVDISKPIFVKSLINDSTKILLEKNWFYPAFSSVRLNNNTFANFSTSCQNGMCSGIILGIEIPDSSTTGTDLRIYQGPIESGNQQQWDACIATEKFDTSYLKEIIFKFSLLGQIAEDRWFAPSFIFVEPYWDFFDRIERDTIIPEWSWSANDAAYFLGFLDLTSNQGGWWESPVMLMHKGMTYPNANNLSYIDLFPPMEDSIQQTINIFVEQGQNLIPQPFANIRGGLVAGNDSVRHILNLINDGGNICMIPFIDLLFDNNTNYVHNGGTVDLNGKFTCMQFSNDSKLVVGENAFFEYGKNGNGLLALRSGGSIEIKNNATLFIGNTLIMHELKGETEPQQIFMELNKGSSLVFGEHAKIHNGYSIDQNMKLNIYMNGGQLDDSKLSPEDRAKINRIYPEPPLRLVDNVKVFPNPTTQFFNYSFILKNEATVEIEIYDMTGRFIFSKKENGLKGWNELQTDISDLQSGVYFFKVKMEDDGMIAKIIKR